VWSLKISICIVLCFAYGYGFDLYSKLVTRRRSVWLKNWKASNLVEKKWNRKKEKWNEW